MSDRIKYPAAKQDVEILDSLVEDYNQDRVSALIGAGLSMNVSSDCYKSWKGLLWDAGDYVYDKELDDYIGSLPSKVTNKEDFVKSLRDEELSKKMDNVDYLQFVSQFIKLKDNNHEAIDTYIEFRMPRAIKEGDEIKLKYINGKEVNVSESDFKVHKQLLSCSKFKNLFTTNYDNLLEFTVENFQSDDNKFAYSHLPVCKSQHLSNSISDKKIIKIHGNLREESNEEIGFDGDRHAQYIISQEDYDTYKQKHEAFAYLMRLSMLLGKFCLIGFSGSDPNYKGWLNWMKDILDKETNDDIKVYLINIKKDYKAHESEEWAYTERMFNRNHRIAVIHLYDKKVLKRINPGFDFTDDDYEEKIKLLNEGEVLSCLFKYIAESEKNFEVKDKPSNTGCFNYDKGYNYYYGLGVNKDPQLAFKYLDLSVTEKEEKEVENKAKALLAECYLYGRGTENNLSKSIEYCNDKDNDDITSSVLFEIGSCYFLGTKGVQENRAEAIEWWKKAAEQRDAMAQCILGSCYYSGEGVSENKTEAVKWYIKAAKQGLALAQFNLGNCYLNGDGITVDKAEAVKWYTKAAEQGDDQAQLNLGYCYQYGEGVPEDKAEAVKWYTKAAEQGLADAQFNLGNCYFNGDGVPEDKAEAMKWYTKAAEQGLALAQFNLGNSYLNGDGITEDKAEAVKWYTKAAEQGYAKAQFNLGNRYYNGEGVPEDKAEAVKWYTKAAEQGHAKAQFNLGNRYYNGEGVPEDKAEAVKWYTKAAEQGHAKAQFNLALCYDNGECAPKDKAEAVKWYTKAAEQGHAKAQLNLALCYDNGEGVPEDKAEAVKWYTKAAEQGHAKAQFNLGNCYDNGEGVPEDKAEAMKWYTKAAEQGDAMAQFNLALCYNNGYGVPEDKAEAVKWYKKAAEQGHSGANNSLAWKYQEQGQYEEALPFINKALEFSPDNANYIDTLAMIYQGLGRYDEAMEQFEKALKIAEEEKDEWLINEIQDHIQALKDQMEE